MRNSILILLFILFPCYVLAQGGKGTYIWPAHTKVVVPEVFQDEPAFYVNNVRTIDFMDGNGSQLVVFKRIYINAEEAAEEFNKMEIYIANEGFISVLAARTIKSNGQVIQLDEDQIIETVSHSKNKYGDQSVRRAQFLFPNVKVGDILDVAYQVDYQNYLYSKLMYLEDDLPSLESKIHLRNASKLQLSIYPLNEMPAMDRSHIGGVPSISWVKHNVPALSTDFFNAIPPDHPSVVYMLWASGKIFDYDMIYDIDEGNYPENFNTAQSITKYFISNDVITGEEDLVVQVQKIIRYFEENLTWNFGESTEYSSQTFGFLKRGKIDYVLFYRYLIKFLTENKVRFEKGFTKSLLDGKFELDVISLEQIAYRFILFTDKKGNTHFLFPPDGAGRFYYLDEIPYYVEENQAICLFGKKGALDEQFGIKIPGSKSDINRHRAYISLNPIAGVDNSFTVERKDILGGQYSYLMRSSSRETWLKELGISNHGKELEPSGIEDYFPYKVNFMQAGDTLEPLSLIKDSLYTISLDALLPKGIYDEEELTMKMGDYLVLPFAKENQITVYLKYDKPIALAEEESAIELSNEIGNVSSTVKQMNQTNLVIEVKLQIVERFIDGAQKVAALKALFQEYANIRQKKWVVALG